MRATRLPKLLLKALRADANSIAEVPLTVEAVGGQTGNLAEFRNSSGTVVTGIAADGSLIQNAGGSKEYTKTVSISAAAIVGTAAGQLGHAAGVMLVADPGAGKVVELVSAILVYTFGVAAYTDGGNVTVNSNGAAVTGLVSAANSLGAAAGKVVQFVPLAAAGNAMTANKGLNLVAAAAFTQPGTAAGTVKVHVRYRVTTL